MTWVADYKRGDTRGAAIEVHLQPRASRKGVSDAGDALKVRVTSPPVDERANRDLTDYLSDLLDLPASRLTIVRGLHGRRKCVVAEGVSPARVAELLRPHLG